MKICGILGCGIKQKARGWCRLHYERWKRTGQPEFTKIRTTCSIDLCGGNHVGRGFCAKHYERFKQHGDPNFVKVNNQPLFATIEETFLAYFTEESDNACWEWQGKITKSGYGRLHFASTYIGVHRFSYMFYHGSIPDKMFVCHKCDNPSCVNPGHLFLGTVQDNNKDCVDKGRHKTFPNARKLKGEMHGMAKLSNNDVLKIKDMIHAGEKDRPIAELFNVSIGAINHIRIGRTWKHKGGENEYPKI